LHPIFLSVKIPSYIKDYTVDFQSLGYKSDGQSYSNTLDLRGFTIDGKIICTSSAANIEDVEISNFSPNFLISNQCNKEEKEILISVINDIKKFNSTIYDKIINDVINKFKIEILFEDLDSGVGGITIHPGYISDTTFDIKTNDISNYNDYKKIIDENLSGDNFIPILVANDGDSLEINEDSKSKYALLEKNSKFIIKLNKKYITLGNANYVSNEKIKLFHTTDSSNNPIDVYSDEHTPRRLELGRVLSHELGHMIFTVNNPLTTYAWDILETKIRLEFKDKLQNVGQGHIKGSPNAREACINDKIFYDKYINFVNNEFNGKIDSNKNSINENSNKYPKKGSLNLPPFDLKYCSNNL
jgi:hypothetical protein